MQTAPSNSLVVFGILQSDGTVRLDRPPEIPPGPVQITIRPIGQAQERIPDLPVEDLSVPTPFDLPRTGIMRVVQTSRVAERLPELLQIAEVT
jgi:hypothetical protein